MHIYPLIFYNLSFSIAVCFYFWYVIHIKNGGTPPHMLPILINYLYVNKVRVVIAKTVIAKEVCHREPQKGFKNSFQAERGAGQAGV